MRTEKQQSKGQLILAALKRAYPGGLTSAELAEITSRAQARLGELRAAGWQITTDQTDADGTATYRLSSLQRGQEEQVIAGVVIRLGSKGGWTSRTHQEALKKGGSIPQVVLDRAEGAALQAYRSVIEGAEERASRCPPPPAPAPKPKPVPQDIFDLIADLS